MNMLASLAVCSVIAVPAVPAPGLWLLPRKDTCNSARADVAGRMATAPVEVWSCGGASGGYQSAHPAIANGAHCWLVQVGSGLRLLDAEGGVVWRRPLMGADCVVHVGDVNEDGSDEALVSLGRVGFSLLDLRTGQAVWTWRAAAGAFIVRCQLLVDERGTRLFAFPPDVNATIGLCLDLRGDAGKPKVLWQRDYAGKWWANYGPNLILADMDNDGRQELVVASKPAYVGVIETDTGEVLYETRYEIEDPLGFGRPDGVHIGRPYGLLQAADMDGDGYLDILLAPTQVEEYVAVLRNVDGKRLEPAWTLFVEKDFPEDHRQLCAQPTSLADVNGDGKPELVLGLYNLAGDERWHTLVLDPLVGYRTPLADLADRYFWGCYDLDGAGTAEIVTSPRTSRFAQGESELEAINGRTLRKVGAAPDGALLTDYCVMHRMTPPLAPDLQYYGALMLPRYVKRGAGGGLLVRRSAEAQNPWVWRAAGGQSVFEPFEASDLEATAMRTRGRLFLEPIPGVPAEPDSEQSAPAASNPLISWADGTPELVVSLADGTVLGGSPDLKRPGQFSRSWRLKGEMPAVWLGPERQRVVFVADADRDIVTAFRPQAGWTQAVADCQIRLPMPLNRNRQMVGVWPRGEGGMIPFGVEQWRLFVPFRLGEHQLGCALYDSSGSLLWQDALVGPHPRLAAVADLTGDDVEDIVVDNHGMQYLYDIGGQRRMIAHVWGDTIPGRGDGCAHALPMIGPYGPNGALRIVMTPGYTALEVQDASGERVAVRPFANPYEFAGRASAVGQLRGPNQWDVGMVSETGVLVCVELETCRDRWALDLGHAGSAPISCCSADLDGDGRDEFLVGLPDGRLVAVTEADGAGAVLWTLQFDSAIRDAIVGDVDGDGLAEIVVDTDDGFVRILRSAEAR